MTQEELIKEIKRLTPEQQQEILDAIGMEQPQLLKERPRLKSLDAASKKRFGQMALRKVKSKANESSGSLPLSIGFGGCSRRALLLPQMKSSKRTIRTI